MDVEFRVKRKVVTLKKKAAKKPEYVPTNSDNPLLCALVTTWAFTAQ